MNEELWSELGIDFEKYQNKIESKRDKGRSLQNKIRGEIFSYIKTKFNLPEEYPTHALNNLWTTNEESFKNLYVLCNSLDKFNEDIIKKYYQKKFGSSSNKPLLYMLIKSFFEDVGVIRQIHYASLLASKKLTSATSEDELSDINLTQLTEENAENYAKQIHRYESQQKTVNVWYILKEDDAMTVFIFKHCKSRAKIPSTEKRRHQFIQHSRPIILRFSNNANLLEVSSRSNEQAYRMASKIISKLASTSTTEVTVQYSQEEIFTSNDPLNNFITHCLNENPDCPFKLQELCCKPNEEFNDCDLIFVKNRDSLKDMTQKIEEALSTSITIEKINSVDVRFKEKLFTLVFDARDNDEFLVAYSSKTPNISLNREFKETLDRLYSVKIVRRG